MWGLAATATNAKGGFLRSGLFPLSLESIDRSKFISCDEAVAPPPTPTVPASTATGLPPPPVPAIGLPPPPVPATGLPPSPALVEPPVAPRKIIIAIPRNACSAAFKQLQAPQQQQKLAKETALPPKKEK